MQGTRAALCEGDRVTIIYGINPVVEALRAGRVRAVRVAARGDQRVEEIFALARQAGVRIDRVETDALTIAGLDESDAPRMRELMEKYRDLPMDLADAALVRVAEREGLTRIFTIDRRHFSIYRPGRRRRFAIVPA